MAVPGVQAVQDTNVLLSHIVMSKAMLTTYRGSCHCQAVQFSVVAPPKIEVERCNCSICSKTGFLHLIVPRSKFTVLKGQDMLTMYTFNTRVAKHTFCKICGVKPFYTPRSNPDGVSVNANCLDTKPVDVIFVDFDGINWEQNTRNLAHKSKD